MPVCIFVPGCCCWTRVWLRSMLTSLLVNHTRQSKQELDLHPQWRSPANTRRWWNTWRNRRRPISATSPGWRCRWKLCRHTPKWSGRSFSARCTHPQRPVERNTHQPGRKTAREILHLMIYDSTNGIVYSSTTRSLLITNIDFQVKKIYLAWNISSNFMGNGDLQHSLLLF